MEIQKLSKSAALVILLCGSITSYADEQMGLPTEGATKENTPEILVTAPKVTPATEAVATIKTDVHHMVLADLSSRLSDTDQASVKREES